MLYSLPPGLFAETRCSGVRALIQDRVISPTVHWLLLHLDCSISLVRSFSQVCGSMFTYALIIKIKLVNIPQKSTSSQYKPGQTRLSLHLKSLVVNLAYIDSLKDYFGWHTKAAKMEEQIWTHCLLEHKLHHCRRKICKESGLSSQCWDYPPTTFSCYKHYPARLHNCPCLQVVSIYSIMFVRKVWHVGLYVPALGKCGRASCKSWYTQMLAD